MNNTSKTLVESIFKEIPVDIAILAIVFVIIATISDVSSNHELFINKS